MKTRTTGMKLGVGALVFGVCVAAFGQQPVITSFSQNGQLVCSNLATGSVASVEWASSLSGPWNTNWAGLDAVTVDSNGMIQASVPMFYRVRGVANTPAGMALIPAGAFTIGDTLDGEGDALPTNVTVSAFYMDTNLVSYSQWQTVYDWATSHGYGFDGAGSGKAANPNQPAQAINWYDAVKWCNARSEREGRVPAYYTSAAQTTVYRTGEVDVTNDGVNWNAGYRLPTEAEWEKAARGGLSGQRFPWGNTISESQANYYGNTGNYSYDLGPDGYNSAYATGAEPFTSPVGSFAPNGYGLYDMAGNVGERCWDWYGASYPAGSPYLGGSDPRGPAIAPFGGGRVVRGGSWKFDAYSTRCANRSGNLPYMDGDFIGFRCVRGL